MKKFYIKKKPPPQLVAPQPKLVAPIWSVRRGEVYMVNLPTGEGSETSGMRPCVILQNNMGNHYSPTTLIAPITSERKPPIPTHVSVRAGDGRLRMNSTILCESIQVIDKKRLICKIGSFNEEIMESVGVATKVSLDLN